ncbi:hypothetical protein [Litoribacter populi]|uniref:hypothetical protein n=1 Tax=Litoribacter populi TaxID=2598460 RepID=UPI00117D9487|nr:hypothetical protein [Litoribacter populi]
MEKTLRGKFYIFLILITCLSLVSLQNTCAQGTATEKEFKFPKDINQPKVDFNLESQGYKQFMIKLNTEAKVSTRVKVYDMVGNLIVEDTIKPSDGVLKKYDMRDVNTQLFVVEIGNSKYNKTKSIYANPAGRRKKDK